MIHRTLSTYLSANISRDLLRAWPRVRVRNTLTHNHSNRVSDNWFSVANFRKTHRTLSVDLRKFPHGTLWLDGTAYMKIILYYTAT